MPIQVACPHCQAKLNAPDSLAGKKIKCPKCAKLGAVPKTNEPPTTPWFVKLDDGSDYGPVPRTELDEWFREGRITEDCQLLKEGSDQWQWAPEIYPSLGPQPSPVVTSPKTPQKLPLTSTSPLSAPATAARTAPLQPLAALEELDTLPAYVEADPLPSLQPLAAVAIPTYGSNAVTSLPPAPDGAPSIAPPPGDVTEETTLQRVGYIVAILPLVVCCMHMAPGWGIGGLFLHPVLGIPIVMLAGLVGGAMVGGRYFIPGGIAGFIGNLGAALATLALLNAVNETNNVILGLVGMLGAAPGFIAFFVLRWFQDLIFPPGSQR